MNGRWTLGSVLAGAAMLVTTALVLLALGAAHSWEPPDSWEWAVIVVPALGLASTATLGGAYAASTAFAYPQRRPMLIVLWLAILCGLVYLISAYLVGYYPEDGKLRGVLGSGGGLWTYMALIVTVPELAAVAALVAGDVRLRARETAEREADEADLERVARERNAAQADADALRAEVNDLRRRLDEAQRASQRTSGSSGPTIGELALGVLRDVGEWLTVADVLAAIEAEHDRSLRRSSLRNALHKLVKDGLASSVPTFDGPAFASARPGENLPELPEAASHKSKE